MPSGSKHPHRLHTPTRRRGLSLGVKLPLFIGGLVALVIVVNTWSGFRVQRQTETAEAERRLTNVAAELVRELQTSSTARAAELQLAAQRPAIRAYLAALPAARDRLADAAMIPLLTVGAPVQSVAVELWSADGRVLLSTGTAANFHDRARDEGLMRRAHDTDEAVIGGLRMANDSVAYVAAVRVTVDGRVAGYVVHWRRLTTQPVSRQDVDRLIGTGGRIFVGDVRDSVWTNLATSATPPPIDVAKVTGVMKYHRRAGDMLAVARLVPATPWAVVVEFPADSVNATARETVRRLLAVDALVLLLGLAGAWWLSRRITTRLRRLTAGVGSVVSNDPGGSTAAPHPDLAAGDEITRLGAAFDSMGRRVSEALTARELSEAYYRDLFESIPLPVYLVALDTLAFLAVNAAAVDYYGYSRDEFLALSLRDIRPPEEVARMEADLLKLGPRPESRGTWRHLKRDGTVTEVEIVSHEIPFRGQRAALTVVTDVTERHRAQQALRRSEERYRTLIRESPYGIALSTPEGVIVEANPALVDILGYTSGDELVGKSVAELYQDPAERDVISRALNATGYCRREALQWKRRDGGLITARLTARLVAATRESDAYVEAIVEDVTERVRLEEQFQLAQRMEAVGRLAGGIAHDFNNLLTVIMTTTELLLDSESAQGPQHAELQDVYRSAQRGAELTRQLLAFSRRQVLSIQPMSVNKLVADVESLLGRLLGEDVQLKSVLTTGPDIVRADPNQVEQVLLNLAVNARDAMPEGGQLVIETEAIELAVGQGMAGEPMAPGAYVRIVVSDNGEGMPPDVREHAFEPFFTTKGKDKGTGLGLATVYGVVKQLGGYVWLYSEVGLGTTFKIYLPRVEDAPRQRAPEPSRRQATEGSETILIAEDEDAIRTLLSRVLTSRGYTVIAEASGEDALRRAAEHRGAIDLLVTDVVMAGMTGPQLAARLADLHPETIPLFLSGYTDEAVLKFGVATGRMAFLQKPFTHTVFLAKVRDVLTGRSEGQ